MKICVVRVLGPAVRERNHAAFVRLRHAIIYQVSVIPSRRHIRPRRDAELRHKIRDGAEKRGVLKEPAPHQIVEAICAHGRPSPRHLNDHVALGGNEFHLVNFGSPRLQRVRLQQIRRRNGTAFLAAGAAFLGASRRLRQRDSARQQGDQEGSSYDFLPHHIRTNLSWTSPVTRASRSPTNTSTSRRMPNSGR